MIKTLITLFVLCCTLNAVVAQEKPTLAPEDYAKWERLGQFQLDPTGAWVVAAIHRVDETKRLELHRIDGNADPLILDHATDPEFSADGKWLAFRQGVSPEEQEDAEEPIPGQLGLVNLTTGQDTVLMAMSDMKFRDDGAWLAVKGIASSDTVGTDVLVFRPGSDLRTTLGNVVAFNWQDEGKLLAISQRSSMEGGNGISIFDPEAERLRVLISGKATFGIPQWKEESASLAAFRAIETENRDGEAKDVLYWKDVAQHPTDLAVLASTDRPEMGDSLGVSKHGSLTFSPDGQTLFIGLRPWTPKEVDPEEEEAETSEDGDSGTGDDAEASADTTEVEEVEEADVQIWHWNDDDILRAQEYWENRFAQRTLLAAWHVQEDQLTVLGSEYDEPVEMVGDALRWGIVGDRDPDQVSLRFGLGTTDWYRVDPRSGKRDLIAGGIFQTPYQGKAGRYILVFEEAGWTAIELETLNKTRFEGTEAPENGSKLAPDFMMSRADYDYPGLRRGWSDLAWLPEDSGAVLPGKYDLWQADFSSGALTRLTAGEDEHIRYRPINMDPEATFFEPAIVEEDGSFWMRVADLVNKTAGYAHFSDGEAKRALWMEARVSGLKKAKKAEVYAYQTEKWNDSPDVFAGGVSLAEAKQITETNAFQTDYAWGHNELLHYTTDAGHALQAVLTYPANFEEGKTYPLILYQYEKLSQLLHGYAIPNERRYYDLQTWSQQGYFILRPDIVYEGGRPGPSALDAVNHALDAALETGHIDPDRLGLIGHSWGGYQAAYLPTRTDRFAASVAGAAITDFISFPGTVHWRGGAEEFGHWETGQARMANPPWEDLSGHLESSPINFINNLNTPVLMMHGDADGVVDFRQGLQYYNYARRAGKPVVMLVYPGAGHGLSDKSQQIDYHRRILTWFGHYLKGEEAPDWLKKGEDWETRKKRLEQ